MSLSDLRREYTLAGLRKRDLLPDPIHQFKKWFDDAITSDVAEPNAVTLATADCTGAPSSRTVLLKGVDERGFIFFTNYNSRKGHELTQNPRAALTVFWRELERQVCLTGTVEKVTDAESDAYFKSRPIGSRLAAWASRQSESIPNLKWLEDQLHSMRQKFPGDDIPRPPHWGGFVIAPVRIEFWQGRPNRLHDRMRYTRQRDGSWLIERLSP